MIVSFFGAIYDKYSNLLVNLLITVNDIYIIYLIELLFSTKRHGTYISRRNYV